jgi:hypothetical protein
MLLTRSHCSLASLSISFTPPATTLPLPCFAAPSCAAISDNHQCPFQIKHPLSRSLLAHHSIWRWREWGQGSCSCWPGRFFPSIPTPTLPTFGYVMRMPRSPGASCWLGLGNALKTRAEVHFHQKTLEFCGITMYFLIYGETSLWASQLGMSNSHMGSIQTQRQFP